MLVNFIVKLINLLIDWLIDLATVNVDYHVNKNVCSYYLN